MSVYPKRLLPGETIFVHVRIKTRSPRRPLMRVLLEDPAGDMRLLQEFQPCVMPMPADAAVAGGKLHPSLQRQSPVYLAARHIAGPEGDIDAMATILAKTRGSVHFHFAHETGLDWPLGRYRIHLEMRSEGQVLSSDTAKDASFHLERVELRDACVDAAGGTATVYNHSSLPVPARLCGIGEAEMWSRPLKLPPGSSELAFKGRQGFLLYSEDRQVVPLTPTRSPHCLRNEALAWLDQPDADRVLVYGVNPDTPGWTLTGASRQIWLAANGLVQREQLRDAHRADVYDSMLCERLLMEIQSPATSHDRTTT